MGCDFFCSIKRFSLREQAFTIRLTSIVFGGLHVVRGGKEPVLPHAVKAANVGAAAESHSHGAGDIDSGTLALARGGTVNDNTKRLANTVFAGPAGGSGDASWRSLEADDLPIVSVAKYE
jgi:hypothetical protein